MQVTSIHFQTGEQKRAASRIGNARALLIVLVGILVLLPVVQAREPDWNYSSPDATIGSIAVSSNGELIAVGAEKVLFFTRSGTLLDTGAFGTTLVMTPDGNYTASAYASAVYFFKNPLPAGTADQQKATKLWDYGFPQAVSSLSMSNDGRTLVTQTVGKDIFIIDTKTAVAKGNNDELDSLVKISSGGSRIIGLSQTKLHSYTKDGEITRTSDLTTFSLPTTMLLTSAGTTVIFNDGQTVRGVNTGNGVQRWIGKAPGYVTALTMNPGGTVIITGTETGNIAALNATGNLSWTYAANPENKQGYGVTCTAVSDKGTVIAAGTMDGKILFLNAKGELTDSYKVQDYIRYIAVSGDGTTAIAATDNMLYVFAPGSVAKPAPAASGTIARTGSTVQTLAVKTTAPTNQVQTPVVTRTSTGSAPAPTVTEIPTTYSVIRTATRGSSSLITVACSLLVVIVVIAWKRRAG
jgi:WD40 repeat protein